MLPFQAKPKNIPPLLCGGGADANSMTDEKWLSKL